MYIYVWCLGEKLLEFFLKQISSLFYQSYMYMYIVHVHVCDLTYMYIFMHL